MTEPVRRFLNTDRVDIVIRDAEVSMHDEHDITVWLDGSEQPITIPLSTDVGTPFGLDQVEVRPAIRAGRAYRVVATGELLFATHLDGNVQFVTPDNEGLSVYAAHQIYGHLELAAEPVSTLRRGMLPADEPTPLYDEISIPAPSSRQPADVIADVVAVAPEYVRMVLDCDDVERAKSAEVLERVAVAEVRDPDETQVMPAVTGSSSDGGTS